MFQSFYIFFGCKQISIEWFHEICLEKEGLILEIIYFYFTLYHRTFNNLNHIRVAYWWNQRADNKYNKKQYKWWNKIYTNHLDQQNLLYSIKFILHMNNTQQWKINQSKKNYLHNNRSTMKTQWFIDDRGRVFYCWGIYQEIAN